MTHNYNIFIEGIQGSGKSTLLETLSKAFPQYKVYREGDISPVELAWCAYMNEEEYQKALSDQSSLQQVIKDSTVKEGDFYIISYTKVRTEHWEFYQYMEQYEIYSGRRSISEFRDIVSRRFSAFTGSGNIFECSLFQNILDEFMLFARYDDDEIISFYKELFSHIDMSLMRLLYIVPTDIKKAIETIKAERVNDKGEEVWFKTMMDYFNSSPYGKANELSGIDDLTAYFCKRAQLQEKLCDLMPTECVIKLKSKEYDSSKVIEMLK